MMNKLLLLLLFVLPQFLLAQNNSSIDFVAGGNYSYRTLSFSKSDSDNTVLNNIFESSQDRESGKFNWTTGIHFNKKISDAWFFRTGLRITSIGYTLLKLDKAQWPIQHNGSGGFDPTLPDSELELSDLTLDYIFLELPLLLRHEFTTNKWSPFVAFGIAPSYFVGANGFSSESLEANPELNKFQLASMLSVGVNYSFDNFQLFAQPTLRYHLTKSVDSPIKEHLYSTGLELGIRKMLGKKSIN